MANSKLTGLTATTAPVSTDIFYIVTDPGGTPTSQKVTGANLTKILTAPASSVDLGAAATPFRSAFLSSTSADTVGAQLSLYKNRGGGTITTGDVLGDINFYGDGGGGALLMGRIRSVSTGTIGSTRVPTTLEFYTATNAAPSVLTKALTLGTDQSASFTGNVGIGTTAPTRPLTVITGTTKVSVGGGALFSSSLNNATGGVLLGSDLDIGYIQGVGGAGTVTKDLVLQNEGGNVGIGTTSSGARLEIVPSTNTNALKSTGYSVTGSGTTSMIDLAGTLNTSGVTDVLVSNITNTASGAGSTLLNLKVGGTSQFKVGMTGGITALAAIDLSGIAAGTSNFILTATSDTPGTTWNVVGTNNPSAAPSGYIEISVGGNARYIPFYA